ncbi:beta-galactosidase [Fimbriimonas ginsengisoli Gsoil 348]|uniref:Beta-galactosidase n=1 Tax=Fimbriimonas ginsengisoli Gsoil 348 TaxID=661478 RepID=A0A068NRD0_FIMGI|nr:beta-galactosidase [Fimbriimonas ginsengisoli Gsoil 348]
MIIDRRIEKKNWRLVSADSQQIDEGPAANAIDGRLETYWHTQYDPTTPKYPHEIVVDMGQSTWVEGFRYVPRQDGGVNGRVKGFAFYLSEDGKKWGDPVLKGEFPNTTKPTRLRFDHSQSARYFRFVALSEVNKGPWASAAEIDILRSRK